MLSIRLFAGPTIEAVESDRAERILQQPKLVALLCYLARERRFVSRHTLFGIFWPELNEDRARAALRKALFHLRHELGEEVVLNRGDHEVGISTAGVWCDVVEFREAIRQEQLLRALDLYRGELLPGLYVLRAPDFERWLEAERSSLQGIAENAALKLAQLALAEGNYEGALRWAARSEEISPQSEEGVYIAILALHHLGENKRALEKYARYATALRDDYGIAPPSRLVELARSIRAPQHISATIAESTSSNARRSTLPDVRLAPGEWDTRFVETATDIMYQADASGYFTQVNLAAVRIMGYTKEQLIGMFYLDLVREDFRDGMLAFYLRQLAERIPSTYYEFPAVSADGRVVWLGQNVQLREDEAGRVVGIQAVAREITAQVRMADAQRNLALRDRVTDLFGPRGFHAMAEDRMNIAARFQHQILLLLVDVHVLGANTGDASLIAGARLLESTFRVSDVKARVTDNRFAILAMEPYECDVEEWFQVIVRRLERVGAEQGFATMPLSVTARLAFSGNSATCDAERLLSICVTDSAPAVSLDFSQARPASFSSPELTPSALTL